MRFQSAAPGLFCRLNKLQTFSRRSDSPIQFYFIISEPRSQQQAGIRIKDLLADLNFCCLALA
jgi:hypothetical protein